MPRTRNCTLWLRRSDQPEPALITTGGITKCRAHLHGTKMDMWRQGWKLDSNYSNNPFRLTLGDLTAELYIEEKVKPRATNSSSKLYSQTMIQISLTPGTSTAWKRQESLSTT